MRIQLEPLGLTPAQMRSVIIETLDRRKDVDGGNQQMSPFLEWIAHTAATRHFNIDPDVEAQRWSQHWIDQYDFDPSDLILVQDVMWDLVIDGIIRPGHVHSPGTGWPYFHLTPMGREQVIKREVSPYDYDGYFRRLNESSSKIDTVIMTYLHESLTTYRARCYLSSAVTLGCASERAFTMLVDAFAGTLPEQQRVQFRKDTEGRPIKRVYEEFMKRIRGPVFATLTGDLKDVVDTDLNGIFNLVRSMRNDAGHPSGKVISEEQAHANLILFPKYLRGLYQLMAEFKNR